MLFYDQNNKEVNFSLEKGRYLNSGNFGDAMLFGDVVLKLFTGYHTEEEKNNTLNILRELSKLDFNNIYEILNFYFDKDGKFRGYLSRYYQNNPSIDILTMPKDYFLDNYYALVRDFNLLHQNGIKPQDIGSRNSVLTDDRIMLVDADFFYKDEYPLENSISDIHGLFSELCSNAVSNFHNKEFENHWDVYYLMWTLLESKQFFEEIKPHKYVIDAVRKRVR